MHRKLHTGLVPPADLHGPKMGASHADTRAGTPEIHDTIVDPTAVELGRLRAEVASGNEALLRLAADFDNFRKRTRRDAVVSSSAEKERFILELLPVLDDLERALDSGQAAAPATLRQGVTMTLRQLLQLLHRHGVDSVEDAGVPFDPHRHEAVTVRNDPDRPDRSVLDVIRRGYRHGDRVIRPAGVVVNGSPSCGDEHAG